MAITYGGIIIAFAVSAWFYFESGTAGSLAEAAKIVHDKLVKSFVE